MTAKVLKQANTARAALLLLCFLLALSAMRSDLFPVSVGNPAPQLEREAVPFALMALMATLLAVVSKTRRPPRSQVQASILIGIGLFVAPALLLFASHGFVSAFTRVALFSLVPIFTVVFEPHIGAGLASQSRGSLLATLLAMAGTLFVFSLTLPSSIESGAAFAAVIVAAACVAAANCYAVRVASALPPCGLAPLAAIACAAAALGLLVASATTERLTWRVSLAGSDLTWPALVSVPSLLLLFWLMPRMTATRMTTRFIIAPLIAVLIGMALDRPSVELRTCAGLLLAAAAAAWLVFAPIDRPDENSAMLNLNR